MKADSIDVILPCLDEAEALPWVLGRMPLWARPIVADNGSTDGSADIARSLGATVVDVRQRGYGSACHAGLQAATTDVVAFMDADASLDPRQLERLRTNLVDDVDLVIGCRRPVSHDAWPWHLRMANREVCRRLRQRTGLRLADLGPMRLARRVPLLALQIEDRRSGYPLETVIRAMESDWQVASVGVDYHPRAGRSKVTGTPLGALRAVADMTRILAS
ncbi:MAG: glycosyltransferase family 2 protein [Dermatophilaceae bacterium]